MTITKNTTVKEFAEHIAPLVKQAVDTVEYVIDFMAEDLGEFRAMDVYVATCNIKGVTFKG